MKKKEKKKETLIKKKCNDNNLEEGKTILGTRLKLNKTKYVQIRIIY